jgi:glycosyltransferase involved in cell wall biosynthesis
VPVLAYAAAAVPYTLGDSGVLFHRKRYDVLAEVVDLLVKDAAIREAVVQRQRQRVAQFSPDAVAAQWRHVIRGCA